MVGRAPCNQQHPTNKGNESEMIMNRLFSECPGGSSVCGRRRTRMMAINHNWIILLAAVLLLTITNGNHIFCRYI